VSSSARTIRTETIGKTTVRLLQTADGYAGMVIHGAKQSPVLRDDDPDVLWRRLLAEVGKAHPNYFGFDGAKARFLKYFPKAFADPGYVFEERDYKDKAVARIAAMISEDQAGEAGPDQCAAAIRAFQATNLVYPVEKSRIKEVLNSEAGPNFLKSAATFADGDFALGLTGMIAAIRTKSQPAWTMLTYLPFMWRPDQYLFLKPAVTCDFANRVGHPFGRDYAEGMTAHVYESLLDLGAETRRQIADLSPKDLIDVQSFIYVVGAYKEDEVIHGRGD
jgi:hypothetical protein